MEGKYPEAFEWFMKGRARNLQGPDAQKITEAVKAAYQASGWQGLLLNELQGFENKTDMRPDFQGAVLYRLKSEQDKTGFEISEKSYQRREPWMSLLKVEPGS